MTLDSIGQFPLVMTNCSTDNNHHHHQQHWSRSELELNPFFPANQSPPAGGFVSSRSSSSSRKFAPVKSRKLSHGGGGGGGSRPNPNYAVVRGWEPNGFDRETKFIPVENYGHVTTAAEHTSQQQQQQQRTDHPLPWTPVAGAGYQDNEHRLQQAVRLKALMLDAAAKDGADEDDRILAASLAPLVRERTRSIGSTWRSLGGRFSPSVAPGMTYDKNGCWGSSVLGGGDDYFVSDRTTISDASLETMRRNLVNLWASKGDDAHGPWTPEVSDELVTRSSSFSYGSSSTSASRWKHSGLEALDGGHLLTTLRQVRQRYDDLPVDVTSRKRRFKTTAAPAVDRIDRTSPRSKPVSGGGVGVTAADTSDPDNNGTHRLQESGQKSDDFAEPSSILRSMLTERGRCYSMSVIEMRRQRCRRLATHSHHSGADASNFNCSATALNLTAGATPPPPPPSDKQLVTLAKKNLLPVTARVTDLLGKTVDFAKSIPQFRRLSLADREALLASSCLRLLLLAMAEANLQFATTVVAAAAAAAAADNASSSGGVGGVGGGTGVGVGGAGGVGGGGVGVGGRGVGGGGSGGEDGSRQIDAKSPRGSDPRAPQEVSRAPTTQFVNSIQNFIRKCQLLDITSEEYLQMKIITLFQSGIGSVDCALASSGVNSSSRQQLQDLVNRRHPNEKLRYSSLLLSLHTLYGVHGGMMRSLFCRHLDKSGGISTFINNSLSTS